jgi:proprotein convertase subtilisin/kexin type 5
MLCNSECLTCQNNGNYCLTCGLSPFQAPLFFYSNQCLLKCPIKFWGNTSSNNCDACHAACLSCTSSGLDSCQSCGNISSTIYYKYIGADKCNTVCPDSQFIDTAIPNFCQKCAPNCITCVNTSDTCTNVNCSKNYFYLNNSCLAACPDNYYADLSLRQCIQCTAGCQSCFASGLNSCTKCSLVSTTQYYLQIGITSCGASCNVG